MEQSGKKYCIFNSELHNLVPSYCTYTEYNPHTMAAPKWPITAHKFGRSFRRPLILSGWLWGCDLALCSEFIRVPAPNKFKTVVTPVCIVVPYVLVRGQPV